MVEWHRTRLECLIEEKCDLIAFETIPSIKEAMALVKLLADYPSTKAWLSFSCKVFDLKIFFPYSVPSLILCLSFKDEKHLSIGDTFKEAYETFKNNPQLVAIGVNCTDTRYVSSLFESVSKEDRTTPFVVYPNFWSDDQPG